MKKITMKHLVALLVTLLFVSPAYSDNETEEPSRAETYSYIDEEGYYTHVDEGSSIPSIRFINNPSPEVAEKNNNELETDSQISSQDVDGESFVSAEK